MAILLIIPCGELEEFARDLAALLDHLRIDQILLAGLSMGGQIALEFYHRFPQRILALILVDTCAQLDPPERKQARYDTADRFRRGGMKRYATETVPKMISPHSLQTQPEVRNHVLSMMQQTNPLGAAAALRGRARTPRLHSASRLDRCANSDRRRKRG